MIKRTTIKRDEALNEHSRKVYGYILHELEKRLQTARADRARTIGCKN
ncbi:hypothetical protein [Citrobacter phage Ci1]|nr:hypothetical protein [Citrobacter phage Ci1]